MLCSNNKCFCSLIDCRDKAVLLAQGLEEDGILRLVWLVDPVERPPIELVDGWFSLLCESFCKFGGLFITP